MINESNDKSVYVLEKSASKLVEIGNKIDKKLGE